MRGTAKRPTDALIRDLVGRGWTEAAVMHNHPGLTRADVRAATAFQDSESEGWRQAEVAFPGKKARKGFAKRLDGLIHARLPGVLVVWTGPGASTVAVAVRDRGAFDALARYGAAGRHLAERWAESVAELDRARPVAAATPAGLFSFAKGRGGCAE